MRRACTALELNREAIQVQTDAFEAVVRGESRQSRSDRPTITAALVAANRRNAQKSTGPRREEGRRRVMLNCLKHGLRCRSFRNSLIKSGADTAAVDRNFLFLTFYLRAQKRHEVHRIARFVQGALELTRWGHRHQVRITQPVRLLKNLMTQCQL